MTKFLRIKVKKVGLFSLKCQRETYDCICTIIYNTLEYDFIFIIIQLVTFLQTNATFIDILYMSL